MTNNTKFTPGKWFAENRKIWYEGGIACIAEVFLGIEGEDGNLPLIATSPELYAELERSHAVLDKLWEAVQDTPTRNRIMDQLTANSRVLAKARGSDENI